MKKKSKLLAVLMCVVMVLANSITVSAASLEVAAFYAKAYDETVVEVEEKIQKQDVLVEYEMSGIPDGAIVEEGEVQGSVTRGSAQYIDWGVGTDVYKRSSRFEAKAGESITISLFVNPKDVVIRAGIQEPDGTLRYVETSESIYHTFSINEDGDYRIYVQNISKTHYVYVSGTYIVR